MSTSGKFLEIRAGASAGTRIKGVQKWECSHEGDNLDATDADSLGNSDTDVGVSGLTFTISGIWSVAEDGPFPVIHRGTLFANLKAFSNTDTDDPDYLVPLCVATRSARTVEVKGQIAYSFEVMSKGAFTIGVGTVTP